MVVNINTIYYGKGKSYESSKKSALTFGLGLVLALVTVWCNADPTRVNAEEMSEVTGGGYEKCVTDPDPY
jgi:hypothetical protein